MCLTWWAKHRSLGTNISKIKSILHLEWEPEEISALSKGGNKSFIDYMSAYGLNNANVNVKYNSVAAEFYRKMLKGYIDGTPVSDLPPTK